MRFAVQFPLDGPDGAEDAVGPDSVADFALAAEEAGFDAIGFTEHPAPPAAWLHGDYGHASLDPFAALGYCAAVTRTLRLMTYLTVLPYRHPFVTAKAAATVDRLSGGRLVLCAGAGYLKEEFDALGLSFTERGVRTEEALSILRTAWSDGVPDGSDFPALRPKPCQAGGPPIWIGGNSRRSITHVARWGDGWSPILVPDPLAAELSTRGLGSLERFREGVADLRRLLREAGRDPGEVEVQVKGPFSRIRLSTWQRARHVQSIEALAEAGATWVVIHPMADQREGLVDVLRMYGSEVIGTFAGRRAAVVD